MVRPRVYNEQRVSTAIRLPQSLHQRLRWEAVARQVSANLIVERAVEEYLNRLPAVEQSVGIDR